MWTHPQIEGEVCPEQRLALAVIVRAIEDALGNTTASLMDNPRALQRDARQWIETDNPDLRWWCKVGGTTPKEVRALLTSRSMSMSKSRTRRSKRSTSGRPAEQPANAPTRGSI